MPTPNATWLMEATREFARNDPTLSDLLSRTTHRHWPIGYAACREKTSGSGNWSDHAWGNALDIYVLGWGRGEWKDPNDPARGNAKPGEPHYLDIIWAWLNDNKEAFDLRDSQMLWRVRLHYNHIHVSFNHRGVGTPPCGGGQLETINPAGGWQLTIDTDTPETPNPPEEEDMPATFRVGETDERWETYCWVIYQSMTGNDTYATYGPDERAAALLVMDASDVHTPSQRQLDHIWDVTGYRGQDLIKESGAQMTQFMQRPVDHAHESDDETGGIIR